MALKATGSQRPSSVSTTSSAHTSGPVAKTTRCQSLPSGSGQHEDFDGRPDQLAHLNETGFCSSVQSIATNSGQEANDTTQLTRSCQNVVSDVPTTHFGHTSDANAQSAHEGFNGLDIDKISTLPFDLARNLPPQHEKSKKMSTGLGNRLVPETASSPHQAIHRDVSPDLEIVGVRSLKRSKIQPATTISRVRSVHDPSIRNIMPETRQIANGRHGAAPHHPRYLPQQGRIVSNSTALKNDTDMAADTVNPRDLYNPPRLTTEPTHTQHTRPIIMTTSSTEGSIAPVFNQAFMSGIGFQKRPATHTSRASGQELSTGMLNGDGNLEGALSQKRYHGVPVPPMNKRLKTDLPAKSPPFAQSAIGCPIPWSLPSPKSGLVPSQHNAEQSMNSSANQGLSSHIAEPQQQWSPGNWTSAEYAALAQMCHSSFPFSEFCSKYKKSRIETEEVFSAIVSIPMLKHCGSGPTPSRGGLGEERVKERRVLCKETREALMKAHALEEQQKAYERRVIRVEVEREVLQRLESQGLLSVIGARMLLGGAQNEGTEIKKDELENQAINLQKRGRLYKDNEDVFGTQVKGRRAPKTKSVEDATAELTAASAELLKAKKAEERKVKLAEQRQMISVEEKEKRKEERKRKREEKKAEKAIAGKNGGL